MDTGKNNNSSIKYARNSTKKLLRTICKSY